MSYPQDSEKYKIKYTRFLENKKIVIVGPAPHLLDREYGKLIDSYDIVVRMNRDYDMFEKHKLHFGSRMDILYSSMLTDDKCGINMSFELLRKKIKWLCAAYPVQKHRQNIINVNKISKGINFHIVDKKYFDIIRNKISFPNVGTIAILDLLRYKISKLFVTGITFYQESDINNMYYYEGYKKYPKKIPTKTSKHNVDKQFRYIKEEIYGKDKRFYCDEVLEKIMKG